MTSLPAQHTSDAPPAIDTSRPPYARDGRPNDAADISRLIELWTPHGLTIPRDETDVRTFIGDFSVVVLPTDNDGDRIVACSALEACGPDDGGPEMGEVRSVAVDPLVRGMGLGLIVVEAQVVRARKAGLRTLVLLTKAPGFFARCGFAPIDSTALPADFLAERIERRGRTTMGRTVMRRVLG